MPNWRRRGGLSIATLAALRGRDLNAARNLEYMAASSAGVSLLEKNALARLARAA